MPTSEEPPAEPESVTVDEAFQAAQGLHRRGKVAEAREVYGRILEVVPEHADALHYAGVAEFQLGRSEEAKRLIEAALCIVPDYFDAHNNLGNVHKRRGELAPAREHYERALALAPESADVVNNLGTILRAEHRLTEALPLFERAVELAADHVEAHHNRGNVLLALGRDDEALEAYSRALMLRPYDRSSYRQLGAAFYATGRLEEAANVYRRWAELLPEDPEAKHMLAACTGEAVPARASKETVKLVFDKFADSFDAVLERLDYKAPALVAETVETVLGAPGASADILDAGCGTGLGGPLLRPYARRLVGVDISDRMIEAALARGVYDEFFVGDLTSHLERHAAAYDLVASMDTLVYFGDLGPVMAGCAKALRPGGHLVFTVERIDSAPNGFHLTPSGRYSHTEDYLRRVVEAVALSVVAVREVVLRKEVGKPVRGYVVAARAPA
jgi:predicted TPR repeat methyltransferase